MIFKKLCIVTPLKDRIDCKKIHKYPITDLTDPYHS